MGQHLIVRRVARSQSSELYLGQRADGELEILKLLPAAREGWDRRLFEAEHRVHSRIRSPHVAEVRSALRESEHGLWFTLEFVDGWTLEDVALIGARLGIDDVLYIGVALARALAAAHDAHVLHRDVKHSNVMVGRRGEVKLIDFGVSASPEADHGSLLSPEQVAGDAPEVRSDLWMLGALLYETVLVHGGASNPVSVSAQRDEGRVEVAPLRSLVSDLPAELDSVVMRALSRDPRERFPAAGDVEVALLDVALAAGASIAVDETAAARQLGQRLTSSVMAALRNP